MADPPTGRSVTCPECSSRAIAIVPRNSTIVEREEAADGKVWTNCRACDTRFLVFYRTS